MEFHGFFQLRRDATGAWNVFNFLNLSYLPRTATAKINQNQKNALFSLFLFFFMLLRDSSRLTDFLKMCKIRFSGSRVSKFWKIHDSETGSRPSFLFQGVFFLNHIVNRLTILKTSVRCSTLSPRRGIFEEPAVIPEYRFQRVRPEIYTSSRGRAGKSLAACAALHGSRFAAALTLGPVRLFSVETFRGTDPYRGEIYATLSTNPV